jgi:hypothetical protein
VALGLEGTALGLEGAALGLAAGSCAEARLERPKANMSSRPSINDRRPLAKIVAARFYESLGFENAPSQSRLG